MALALITDLVARGRARILNQYLSLTTRFLPLVDVWTAQAQELETAVWGFMAQLDIATATGIWLDRLGWIVGEAREGEDDTVYRQLIQARIIANGSSGEVETIYEMVLAALGDPPGIVLTGRDCSPASFELQITGYVFDMTDPAAVRLQNRLQRLLQITRSAGVRLMVMIENLDEATAFKFSSSAALAASAVGFADANDLSSPAGHFRTAFVA